MKTKTRITKEPYSKVCAFAGGLGGILTVIGFGLTGPVGLVITGGLTAVGYACGKKQAREEAQEIEAATENSAAQVSNYISRNNDFQYAENRIKFDADDMTPLGGMFFGKKIEITRYYDNDE